MAQIIKQTEQGTYAQDTRIEHDPERLRALTHPLRWSIMEKLSEAPRYPADLASELDCSVQSVYYHINTLHDLGLIQVTERQERGGSVAKFYEPVDTSFTLELPGGESVKTDIPLYDRDRQLRRFFRPITGGSSIEGHIVVGSPEPHGPHQVRGKDGHHAVDLAATLGRLAEPGDELTKLDVEVTNEQLLGQNLILIGGPLTNTVTGEFNAQLPIRFDEETFPYRGIVSSQSGDVYTDDTVGMVVKMRNPRATDRFIYLVAGNRAAGTRAAVMAITSDAASVLEEYEDEDMWGCVVKGKDMDGDGHIDAVERLE
ncbi:MAG: helix-turn-helix domain-containing protein [Candidatus Nanohaloarchaeota archaeon QJJ-5]|nr:helix-turn-helix domain-containing protein [Candidatus Nanohaloarchaeota archaeon QJJ-5]